MTSKVAQFPIAGSGNKTSRSHIQHRTGGVAPLNPTTFVPSFDVLTELADNKDQYVGDDYQTTIYGFPSSLRTSLDRVRARVITVNKPGLLPTIACCLSYGIEILSSDEDIKSLIDLNKEFILLNEDVKSIDAVLYEEVSGVLRSFPLTVPDLAFAKCYKQNVSLTESIRVSISKLTELGLSFSVITILGVMITLMEQPCVLKDRREQISESISLFLKRVKIRKVIIEALLEVFKDGRSK